MPKDIIYPHFIARYKGWYIYKARSESDIPYRAMKKGKRSILAESYKDVISDIKALGGKRQ